MINETAGAFDEVRTHAWEAFTN